VVKKATISGMAAYEALCKEADQDYAGYWARLAREHVTWKQPFTQSLDESGSPLLQVVCRRQAERFLQLPRPQYRSRPGRQGRHHFRSRRRPVTKVTYKELLTKVSSSPTRSRRRASRRATAS
jgi:acetyl-CoA synthetase